VPDLIALARRWADADWPDGTAAQLGHEDADLLPVTAWRVVADLTAEAAVKPLAAMLSRTSDEFDDWICEEWPHVFGKLGEPAVESLMRIATDRSQSNLARVVAVNRLSQIAQRHATAKPRIVAVLIDLLGQGSEAEREINTMVVTERIHLNATEAAEAIEHAFAADLVDVGMTGSWEDVRDSLGVEGLGLKMPEAPYDSLGTLRASVRGSHKSNEIEHNRLFDSDDSPSDTIVRGPKIVRNEPCRCGSGHQFK
jgi:hypothetical protein